MYEGTFLVLVIEMMRGFCDNRKPSRGLCCCVDDLTVDLHTNTHSRVGFHRRNINITKHRCLLQAINGFIFKTSCSESISNTAYQDVTDELLPVGLPNRSINRPGYLSIVTREMSGRPKNQSLIPGRDTLPRLATVFTQRHIRWAPASSLQG